MRQILTIAAIVTITVVLLLMALIGHYLWQLHPWVPAGRALAMGNWHFGDCEFQVWQRKNWEVTEPFADGLFVRQGTNGWQAFCFDIQDSYLPRVKLVPEKDKLLCIVMARTEVSTTWRLTHFSGMDRYTRQWALATVPLRPVSGGLRNEPSNQVA